MKEKKPKSWMRQLAGRYHAGAMEREAFIEAMLAFDWHPGRWVLSEELRGANSAEKTAYHLRQIGLPTIPDSVGEFRRLTDAGLIDLPRSTGGGANLSGLDGVPNETERKNRRSERE